MHHDAARRPAPRRPIVLMASSSRGGKGLAGGTHSSSSISAASGDDELAVESDVIAAADPAKFISQLCREALTAARESPAGAGANSYSIFPSALCLSLVFAGSAGNKSLRFSTQYFI